MECLHREGEGGRRRLRVWTTPVRDSSIAQYRAEKNRPTIKANPPSTNPCIASISPIPHRRSKATRPTTHASSRNMPQDAWRARGVSASSSSVWRNGRRRRESEGEPPKAMAQQRPSCAGARFSDAVDRFTRPEPLLVAPVPKFGRRGGRRAGGSVDRGGRVCAWCSPSSATHQSHPSKRQRAARMCVLFFRPPAARRRITDPFAHPQTNAPPPRPITTTQVYLSTQGNHGTCPRLLWMNGWLRRARECKPPLGAERALPTTRLVGPPRPLSMTPHPHHHYHPPSQPFVKVLKNKQYFKRYQVKFRRRRGKCFCVWLWLRVKG